MTTVAFRSLTNQEQIFYDLIFLPMLKLGETWVEGEVPFLSLPIIKQVGEGAFEIIANYVFNQLVLFIDINSIELINAEHQAAFDDASLKLAVVAHDKGISSPEFAAAKAVAKAALSKFTNIAGGQ